MTVFNPVVLCVLPQEGELELEAEPAKASVAAQSEVLRDPAPVIEGIKVTNMQPVRS